MRSVADCQTLERRQLLCSTHADWTAESLDTYGPQLEAALARNGADHDISWYAPARNVSANVGGDAAPTFPVNAAGLPLLTSRADGVGTKIFLDFDGNGTNLPFGIDADDTTFNAEEQTNIYESWRDIVSFFSPFNVNVTTIQPPTGGTNPLFAWHLTSKSISGGYAGVNSLTRSAPTGFNQAGDGVSRHSGIAHELGHIFSLSHQGEWDKLGVKTAEYSDGFGARDAVIIGIDYQTNVRNFIYGRTSGSAATLQNDISAIASRVASVAGGDGYRPDDFGGTLPTAYIVPANVQQIPAYIERQSDQDVFQVTVPSAGSWHFDATPTYESAAAPKLELLDSTGNLLASRDDADQRNQRNNDVEFSRNMEPGTYYVRVSTSGDYSELGEYLLTASPLPTGFVSNDVSTTIDRGGTASFDPNTGVLTQLGAGSDIFSTADQFRFTHDTLTGNGSITTRVLSLDNFNVSGKAGVMFRTSTANNSPFMMLSVKPAGDIELIQRATAGASATVLATALPGGLSRWLRLSRAGNVFTAQYSSDGIAWTTLGSPATLALPTTTLTGFATTSHSTREAAYAEFDNITLTGTFGETAPTFNALAAPTDLTAVPVAGASTAVLLNWTDVAGESNYAVERSVDGVTFIRIANAIAANTTTYTDNLTFGSMRWWYRVVALSGSTGSVPSGQISVVNKPSAPTIPVASYAEPAISPASGTAIYLNWSDVQGDAGYRVERSTNGTTFTLLGTTGTNLNAYNDTGVVANTGYIYRITPLTPIGDGIATPLTFETGTRWTTSAFKLAARTATSMTVTWTDFSSETGYRIERTTNGVTGWTSVATLPADRNSWVDTSVTQLLEYYYRVVADLPLGEIVSSTIAFGASLPLAQLPAGWSSGDVGATVGLGIGGSSTGGSTFKVIGGGTSIGSSPDSFDYLYRPLAGDGSITVRVDSQKSNELDDNAEAGIMIRESLASNAPYAFVNVEPGRFGQTDFEYRTAAGGGATNISGTTTRSPIWMRLTRAGSTFTAEYSTTGTTWTLIGTQAITMSAANPIYIGMAVSAIEPNLMSNAVFSSVAIVGNTSANQKPTISSAAFASPVTVTGTTAALNVIAADDGGEAALTYTWSALSVPVGKPAPTFSAANGTNAAKNMTATFGGTGVYSVRVTATDALGLSVTSDVVISVTATLTSLAVTPANFAIAPGATQLFSVAAVDQFGGAMTLPPVTWSSSAGSITAGSFTAPAAAGPITITATNGSISGSTTARVNLVAATPTYDFTLSPHTLSVAFNGDVSASLLAGDFVITNFATSEVIPSTDLSIAYNAASNTATLSYLPGAFPDGSYVLSIASANVSLADGQLLSAPVSYNFSFLRGDVTGDRVVGFDDLLILAQNYGQSGRTYLQGDLTYDGVVNFDDLLLLTQRYGNTLVRAQAIPARRRPSAGSDVIA